MNNPTSIHEHIISHNGKNTVTTSRLKAKTSLLPGPSSSSTKNNKWPSTLGDRKKILQSSTSISPIKSKSSRQTAKQRESKLHSSSLHTKPSIPQTSLSIDDDTIKIGNSFAKQRTVLSMTKISTPKKTSKGVNTSKVARKSTGSMFANDNISHSDFSLLTCSLTASSSEDSDCDKKEAVKVCVRIRPVFDTSSEKRAWTTTSSEDPTIVNTGNGTTDNNIYRFDNVYGEEATTQQVYDNMVKDIVSSVCHQGRNGTVFTYGQTSTGKTYTMHGIISAAAKDIFGSMVEKTEKAHGSSVLTSVNVSCMELYNEELRDLLDQGRSNSSVVTINDDRCGNVQVTGLSKRVVGSVEDLMSVVMEAEMNRSVGSTAMNERSSRSHTIFRITHVKKEAKEISQEKGYSVESTDSEDGVECIWSGLLGGDDKENGSDKITRKKMITTVSTLNLVDLAGSESVRHTGAIGDRQTEGRKINQSLLALSTVLVKLGKKDPGHINYRDSKLTRILQSSLSGNARMSAICCISPMLHFQDESKSTLDFATRTMRVTTNATKNQTIEYDDAVVGQFEKKIARLRAETAIAEKDQQKLVVNLQESEEQIVCLMATIEIEKSKVANLEKHNYEMMMQVEQLTLLNEELKDTDQTKTPVTDKVLLQSMEELKLYNEHLEERIGQLLEEKAQLEFKLLREMKKTEKKKEVPLERRKLTKSKIGGMKTRLMDDISM